jgi:prepilin-type N-terminal cleavage/methylation domain-containing protein
VNKVSRQQTVDCIKESRKHGAVSIKGKTNKILYAAYCLLSTKRGFTMVELLITMVVFVFVMAAGSQIFSGLLTQFKQQSKIAETNIEGAVGLDMMRQDLERAGYGLPWIIPATVSYREAAGATSVDYNDCNGSAPCNAPRAIVSGNNISFSGFTDVDYVAIKATNLALNDASQRWTTLKVAPFSVPDNPRQWTPATENLIPSDRVIVISPGSDDTNARRLVDNGGNFYTTFGNVTNAPWPPTSNLDTRLVYGINSTSDLLPQRPFNRADYFITGTDQDGNNITPQRCAQNTGVLVKAVMNHDESGSFTYLPLLDCVADLQVVYRWDMDEDGSIRTGSNADGSTISNIDGGEGATVAAVQATLNSAADLRRRLREIRVFILAHEGQRDPNYTYASNSVYIGDTSLGRTFNLTAIPNWQNYRWKVYSISVNTVNLPR